MGKTKSWALGQRPAGLMRGGPLKIGVIGVGVMGSNHARVLSEMAGVTLVGVVDPDRTQRELVGRNLGCVVFADLVALIESGFEAGALPATTHLHPDRA